MAAETVAKRPRSDMSDASTSYLDLDATDRVHEISAKYGNSRLTRGAFGELSIAIDANDNGWRLAVVKTIPQATVSTGSPWDRNAKRMLDPQVFNEIMALRVLSSPHPNIVSFLGLFLSNADALPGSISMAFEYNPLDLHMLLDKREALLPIGVCKTMTRDILSAICHCHSHGILHRDVKTGNLLVSANGSLQLCDFGLARSSPELTSVGDSGRSLPVVYSDGSGTKGLCTLWYRPPEVLLSGRANHPSVDMYSAGLVIAELLTSRVLFRGEGVLDQLGRIFALLGTPTDTHWPDARHLPDYGKVKFHPKPPQSLALSIPRLVEEPALLDLMNVMICLDPAKRTSASSALRHDWLDTDEPTAATHQAIADLFIPDALKEPKVLFSTPQVNDSTLTVARNHALKIAAARRSYFESSEVSKRTLVEACQALQQQDE